MVALRGNGGKARRISWDEMSRSPRNVPSIWDDRTRGTSVRGGRRSFPASPPLAVLGPPEGRVKISCTNRARSLSNGRCVNSVAGRLFSIRALVAEAAIVRWSPPHPCRASISDSAGEDRWYIARLAEEGPSRQGPGEVAERSPSCRWARSLVSPSAVPLAVRSGGWMEHTRLRGVPQKRNATVDRRCNR